MTEHTEKSILENHERRISDLEKNYAEVKKDMDIIQNTQIRMETSLLNESRKMMDTLNKVLDQKFLLDKTQLKQTFDLEKTNLLKKWEFWIAACGSGGFLYLLIEFLTK